MEVEKIAVDAIEIGSRMRSVNTERVGALAESIKAIGLQTPISVWANDDGTQVQLVAGAHRLAAVKQLGWEDVDCVLVNMDEIDRKLWEIAENLHRSELTAKERAEQIAEWVRLAEEKRKRKSEVLTQVVAKPNGGRPESGTRAAARELGLNRETVRRAVKIASISDEAKQAADDAGLSDNQSALERIARAGDQVGEVQRICEERAAKAAKPQTSQRDERDEAEDEEPEYSVEEDMAYASIINAMDATTDRVRADVILEYASFARRVLGEHGYL